MVVEALGRLGIALTDGAVRDREVPDFHVEVGPGRVVGIEVVEARAARVAEARATIKRFKQAVTEMLNERGLRRWIHFRTFADGLGLPRGRAALQLAARTLVDAVEALVQMGAMRGQLGQAVLEKKVGLRAARFEPSEGTWATYAHGGWGQPQSLIADAIKSKENKLTSYRASGATEYWLLVVAGAGAGGVIDPELAETGVFESSFDRVVYLELFEKLCFDLRIRPPAGAQRTS